MTRSAQQNCAKSSNLCPMQTTCIDNGLLSRILVYLVRPWYWTWVIRELQTCTQKNWVGCPFAESFKFRCIRVVVFMIGSGHCWKVLLRFSPLPGRPARSLPYQSRPCAVTGLTGLPHPSLRRLCAGQLPDFRAAGQLPDFREVWMWTSAYPDLHRHFLSTIPFESGRDPDWPSQNTQFESWPCRVKYGRAPQLHIAAGGNLLSMARLHPGENFWHMSVDGDPLASAYSGEELVWATCSGTR